MPHKQASAQGVGSSCARADREYIHTDQLFSHLLYTNACAVCKPQRELPEAESCLKEAGKFPAGYRDCSRCLYLQCLGLPSSPLPAVTPWRQIPPTLLLLTGMGVQRSQRLSRPVIKFLLMKKKENQRRMRFSSEVTAAVPGSRVRGACITACISARCSAGAQLFMQCNLN